MRFTVDQLAPYSDPIRFTNAQQATLEQLKEAFKAKREEYGLNALIRVTTVNEGGFRNRPVCECLTIFHPDHEYDYYNFVVTRHAQGNTAVFQVYTAGDSTNLNREAFSQNPRVFDGTGSRNAMGGILRGGAFGVGAAVGSVAGSALSAGIRGIAKGVNAMLRDPMALMQEQDWYDLASSILQELLFSN